jgi:hypothetical protein
MADERNTMSRIAALLIVIFALTGCQDDRAQDIAICQNEAARFYAPHRAVDPEDPVSRFIIGCMAAKDHDFTIAAAACNSEHPLSTQPACYTSRTWFGWFIERLRGD